MRIINAQNKSLNWFSRNYFYIATLATIVANVALFYTLGSRWAEKFLFERIVTDEQGARYLPSLFNFLHAFLTSFSHGDVKHLLFNMLCLFIAGLYLERKTGSIGFFVLLITLCFFSGFAVIATRLSNSVYGFSWVNYALNGFIVIDILLTTIGFFVHSIAKQKKKGKTDIFNLIFALIALITIGLDMFFDGKKFSFSPQTNNLFKDVHWPGMIAGALVALLVNTLSLAQPKEIS